MKANTLIVLNVIAIIMIYVYFLQWVLEPDKENNAEYVCITEYNTSSYRYLNDTILCEVGDYKHKHWLKADNQ